MIRAVANAYLTPELYAKWYQQSLDDPAGFWGEKASELISWSKPWDAVLSGGFEHHNARWFAGAWVNAAYNCLDRHLPEKADQPAIIWESDDKNISKSISYKELHEQVCRFANVLKQVGVKQGDRVCLYLPMIPEVAVAMLACARIGAIHSVVFAGFSADALKTRILDADCRVVVTANEGVRGNKIVPLKESVDQALEGCPEVKSVLVVKRTDNTVPFQQGRDYWYHNLMAAASTDCPAVEMASEDPLFILYTSGSTGKPKGILHGTGGYLLYAAITHRYVFNYHPGDIFWCTADVGWITGHTYTLYGPLLNGGTTVLFEGVPHYPTPSRYWEVIDKHGVTIFYTAPTAIRALRREGDDWVKQTSRKSLKILGSVGEPINPEAWEWYDRVVGEGRCFIVDTWWQTETGAAMMTPLPGVSSLKPGSAAIPFFGVQPDIIDDAGHSVTDGKMGRLIIKRPWPGIMQTVYGNEERFVNAYFQDVPGCYLTGDQAFRDADGYYWIAGRSDDVIKVSGHRIGTQEVESALIRHPSISEAAVVAIPDEIKGNSIYAYVTLKTGLFPSPQLKQELAQLVGESIGKIAIPDHIQCADGLPKTRSGKIMRRLLRKIATNDMSDLGDLSTLADPGVVEELMRRS